MATIFMSYRRKDTGIRCERICDRLKTAFGKDNVFLDIDDLPPGAEFPSLLKQHIDQSDAVLVLIGRDWLTATDNAGRRLDNPDDFVRTEVETALNTPGCLVIPVLIDGAQMPSRDDLPPSMQALTDRNAVSVRDGIDFNGDMARLIKGIKERTRKRISTRVMIPALVVTALAVTVLILLATQLMGDDNGGALTPNASATLTATPTDEPDATPTSSPSPRPSIPPTPLPSPTITPDPSDPITLLNSFPAPGRSAEGITWDGTNIWVSTNDARLFQVDTTGKPLGSYSPPDVTPGGMTWDGEHLWLYTTNRSQLYQVEIEDLDAQAAHSITAPTQTIGGGITNDLAWDDAGYLWYVNQYNLFQLDPSSGEIVNTIVHPENIVGLELIGDYLWVIYNRSFENAVLNVLNTSGDVVAAFDLPVFEVFGLAQGEPGTLWVTGSPSFTENEHYIFELDASVAQASLDTQSAQRWRARLFMLYEAAQLSQSGIGLTPEPPWQPQAGMTFLVGDVGLNVDDYDEPLEPADIALVDAEGHTYSPVGLETIPGSYVIGTLSGMFTLQTREPARLAFDYVVERTNGPNTQTFRAEAQLFAGESGWPVVRLVWEVPADSALVALTLPNMSVTDIPAVQPLY